MKTCEEWLRSGASWEYLFKNLFLILIVQLTISICGDWVALTFTTREVLGAHAAVIRSDIHGWSLPHILIITAVIVPLMEECIFRVLPFSLLFIILWLVRLKGRPLEMPLVLTGVVITSAVFGYVHGSLGSILIQGSSGVVLSLVFLKWSSLGSSFSKVLQGYGASAIVHGSYNAIIFSLMYAHGLTR